MSSLQINGLNKLYGDFVAVDDFNIDVQQGEFIVFLGPSGCGKTTTLRMVAGFVKPTSGSIRLGANDITKAPVYRRNIGMVFQNYALFPHLSVFENVAFGLRRRKQPEAVIAEKVESALKMVQMAHLKDRRPSELSGGQQQRVAIARATAIDPALMLFDEPLSNLDARLRLDVRQEIRWLQKKLGVTAIFVTHDQEEAMSIADRLVVMNAGKIQQVGTPEEIYSRPANRFVASFIGTANCFDGSATADGRTFVTSDGLPLVTTGIDQRHKEIMIRAEAIEVAANAPDAANVMDVSIDKVTFLGSSAHLRVVTEQGVPLLMQVPARSARGWLAELTRDNRLRISIPEDAIVGLG